MDTHFNQECLAEHNRLRKLHGCPPLKLSRTLARDAQEYAEYMAMEQIFEHSECSDYGENLITRRGPKGVVLTGRQAALAWYSEITFYDFNKENQTNCGHFCQLVWKDTQKAGFGVARSGDGRAIYVVGRYKKPGNYLDCYRENVPPPRTGVIYVPTDNELTGIAETWGRGRCKNCNSKLYYYRRRSKKSGNRRNYAAQAG